MSREGRNEEGFAGRWSRMKRGAKAQPPQGREREDRHDAAAEPAEERPDAEVLAELGLPDPETLKPGDDFAAFMSAAVPARIRNRALRRLWASNPVMANLDALVDYGEDFTDAATVVENLQTAYRVGKGIVERLAGPEEAKRPGGADAAAGAPVEAGEQAGDGTAGESAAPEAPAAETTAEPAAELADGAAPEGGPGERPRAGAAGAVRRRMRFRVEEG